MAPPKKYEEKPNLFSYRRDKKTWSKFALIAKIKETSPTEIFDQTVEKYIQENEIIISALPKTEGISTSLDIATGYAPLDTGAPDAETPIVDTDGFINFEKLASRNKSRAETRRAMPE
jgi:hypothetical protein